MVIQEKYCFEAQALAEEKKRVKFTVGERSKLNFHPLNYLLLPILSNHFSLTEQSLYDFL